ncbi:hypothetical protein ACVW19_006747 [Streptomyces sp. TE5632]
MVARLMGRERKLPAPCTPAHAPHLIGYTTTRDAIRTDGVGHTPNPSLSRETGPRDLFTLWP